MSAIDASHGRKAGGEAEAPRSPAENRIWRGCLLGFLMGVVSGCYVYPPVTAVPATGARVLVELNDLGRVGLGESIGPSSEKIEGVVETVSDTAIALAVASVGYVNGETSRWRGERLVVSRAYVKDVRAKQYSRGRTWLTIGVGAGALAAFIATRVLVGSGSGEREPGGGQDPPAN